MCMMLQEIVKINKSNDHIMISACNNSADGEQFPCQLMQEQVASDGAVFEFFFENFTFACALCVW